MFGLAVLEAASRGNFLVLNQSGAGAVRAGRFAGRLFHAVGRGEFRRSVPRDLCAVGKRVLQQARGRDLPSDAGGARAPRQGHDEGALQPRIGLGKSARAAGPWAGALCVTEAARPRPVRGAFRRRFRMADIRKTKNARGPRKASAHFGLNFLPDAEDEDRPAVFGGLPLPDGLPPAPAPAGFHPELLSPAGFRPWRENKTDNPLKFFSGLLTMTQRYGLSYKRTVRLRRPAGHF